MSKRSGNPAVRAGAAIQKNPDARAILLASNAPFAETGYGQQSAQLLRRLKADGHSCAIAANYGLEGTVSSWEGMRMYPRGFELHSSDVVPAYFHAWAHDNPDLKPLLITLYDVWVYKGQHWDTVPQIAPWVPIDHFPVPADVLTFLKRDNVTPIAMSRFGEQMMTDANVECLYAPHAIDTKVFKPTESFTGPDGNPMTGREFMGIPADKFVVTMVSANKGVVPNRKAFPEAFLAFGMFAQQYPDAVLYCHTEATGSMGGIDLIRLAKMCGIKREQIVFPDPFVWRMGVPAQVLASVYTASDVFLQPSMGEGFGIPLVEAGACGTRGIVSNATAQPELLGDGWLVDGQPWWDAMQKAWLWAPRVESILQALVESYDAPRERSAKAIDFAQQYEADFVFDAFWRPALKVLGL
jgi:glycosyltransferase involved in cell wall biosynthesis